MTSAQAPADGRGAALASSRRGDYPAFLAIATRWIDNDTYGHVNNVTYYAYFDTVVNEHLVRAGGLEIRTGQAIGIVVETACRFHRPLSFPDSVDAGMRVAAIGRSSVRYEIALFRRGDDEPAATGRFVHVWVDRVHRRPVPVPARIRAALEPLRARNPALP
jgi:acyl-CoA thioester hydrolase